MTMISSSYSKNGGHIHWCAGQTSQQILQNQYDKKINSIFKDCKTTQELFEMLEKYLDHISCMTITGFFSSLSRILRNKTSSQKEDGQATVPFKIAVIYSKLDWNAHEIGLIQRLYSKIFEHMDRMDGRAISSILSGLIMTKHYPYELVPRLLDRLYQLEGKLNETDYSTLCLGLRRLNYSDDKIISFLYKGLLNYADQMDLKSLSRIIEAIAKWRAYNPSLIAKLRTILPEKITDGEAEQVLIVSCIFGLSTFCEYAEDGGESIRQTIVELMQKLPEDFGQHSLFFLSRLIKGLANCSYSDYANLRKLFSSVLERLQDIPSYKQNTENFWWSFTPRNLGGLLRSLSSAFQKLETCQQRISQRKDSCTDSNEEKTKAHLLACMELIKKCVDRLTNIIFHPPYCGPYPVSNAVLALAETYQNKANMFDRIPQLILNSGQGELGAYELGNILEGYTLLGRDKAELKTISDFFLSHTSSESATINVPSIRYSSRKDSPYQAIRTEKNAQTYLMECLLFAGFINERILTFLKNSLISMSAFYGKDEFRERLKLLKKLRVFSPQVEGIVKKVREAYVKERGSYKAVPLSRNLTHFETAAMVLKGKLAARNIVDLNGLKIAPVAVKVPRLLHKNWEHLVNTLTRPINPSQNEVTLATLLSTLKKEFPEIQDTRMVGSEVDRNLKQGEMTYYKEFLAGFKVEPIDLASELWLDEDWKSPSDVDIRLYAPTADAKKHLAIGERIAALTGIRQSAPIIITHSDTITRKSQVQASHHRLGGVDISVVSKAEGVGRDFLYNPISIPLDSTLKHLANGRASAATEKAPSIALEALGKGDLVQQLFDNMLKIRHIDNIKTVDKYGWIIWLVGKLKGIGAGAEGDNQQLVENALNQLSRSLPDSVWPAEIARLIVKEWQERLPHTGDALFLLFYTACNSLRQAKKEDLAERVWEEAGNVFNVKKQMPSIPWFSQAMDGNSSFKSVQEALSLQTFLWAAIPSEKEVLVKTEKNHENPNFILQFPCGDGHLQLKINKPKVEWASGPTNQRECLHLDVPAYDHQRPLGNLVEFDLESISTMAAENLRQAPTSVAFHLLLACYAMQPRSAYLFPILDSWTDLYASSNAEERKRLCKDWQRQGILIPNSLDSGNELPQLLIACVAHAQPQIRKHALKYWQKMLGVKQKIGQAQESAAGMIHVLAENDWSLALEMFRIMESNALCVDEQRLVAAFLLLMHAPNSRLLMAKALVRRYIGSSRSDAFLEGLYSYLTQPKDFLLVRSILQEHFKNDRSVLFKIRLNAVQAMLKLPEDQFKADIMKDSMQLCADMSDPKICPDEKVWNVVGLYRYIDPSQFEEECKEGFWRRLARMRIPQERIAEIKCLYDEQKDTLPISLQRQFLFNFFINSVRANDFSFFDQWLQRAKQDIDFFKSWMPEHHKELFRGLLHHMHSIGTLQVGQFIFWLQENDFLGKTANQTISENYLEGLTSRHNLSIDEKLLAIEFLTRWKSLKISASKWHCYFQQIDSSKDTRNALWKLFQMSEKEELLSIPPDNRRSSWMAAVSSIPSSDELCTVVSAHSPLLKMIEGIYKPQERLDAYSQLIMEAERICREQSFQYGDTLVLPILDLRGRIYELCEATPALQYPIGMDWAVMRLLEGKEAYIDVVMDCCCKLLDLLDKDAILDQEKVVIQALKSAQGYGKEWFSQGIFVEELLESLSKRTFSSTGIIQIIAILIEREHSKEPALSQAAALFMRLLAASKKFDTQLSEGIRRIAPLFVERLLTQQADYGTYKTLMATFELGSVYFDSDEVDTWKMQLAAKYAKPFIQRVKDYISWAMQIRWS